VDPSPESVLKNDGKREAGYDTEEEEEEQTTEVGDLDEVMLQYDITNKKSADEAILYLKSQIKEKYWSEKELLFLRDLATTTARPRKTNALRKTEREQPKKRRAVDPADGYLSN
jgi:uncharacterized FlgJ-related protein